MTLTFGEACDRLRGFDRAYGCTDLKAAINSAVQSLSHLSAWKCLRRVLRLSSASPVFALPQGYAGLVRVCVNGRPATLRGQDFRFALSGPGDMNRPPFQPVLRDQVLDLGAHPLIDDPKKPFRLVAVADGDDEPPVKVRGLDKDGRLPVSAEIPVVHGEPSDADPDKTVFSKVDAVTIDKCAEKTVRLYACCADDPSGRYQVAEYHPGVRVPTFRRYGILGMPPDMPVELLAEVRLDPFPLVDDDDVLPFDDVEPIQYMIMYGWKMRASEVDVAQKYLNQAQQWLKAQEVAEDTVQTPVRMNVQYDGSLGELSDYVYMV